MANDRLPNWLLCRKLLGAIVLLLATCGCSLTSSQTVWRQTSFAVPDVVGLTNWSLAAAEELYATAVEMESRDCADCVEYYFQTATYVWPALERELETDGKTTTRTAELYNSSVAKLLVSGQKFGCWDPCQGLTIASSSGKIVLPASYTGFVWEPEEFHYLEPVGDYESPNLTHAFRSEGLGVPLVAVRHTKSPQPFTQALQSFAATVVLRTDASGDCYQLEFFDPLRVSTTSVGSCQVPLIRDLTAPFAYTSQGEDRVWLDDFLRPGASGSLDGLYMIEPYQPGKISVVLVHGLLSDKATWADLVNELRAHPELNDHYQWWAFEYATGEPFLTSAAVLRQQLVQIRNTYDPERSDPAFSQIVLIGHSMGGLVSKLQVTESGDWLWRAVAQKPFANVRTSDETRQRLHEAFYFHPSSDVTRVVFMGTPHQGSPWARRPIGRLGSALVEISKGTDRRHNQLVRDNPGLFRGELQDRFPTSIDLLEPTSPLLGAMASLPIAPTVTLHSTIGYGQTTWHGEPSDGVVPVSSARLVGVASELMVESKHEALHRNSNSVAEIVRILREHLRNSQMLETASGSASFHQETCNDNH